MKKSILILLSLAFAFQTFAQTKDYEKGTLKVRKPYQHEFFLDIDTTLIFTKGNLADYIKSKIIYTPELNKALTNCTTWVSSIVDETGNVTFAETKKSCNPVLDKEAIRIISALKGFKPLVKNNKKFAVRFDIPVKFSPK